MHLGVLAVLVAALAVAPGASAATTVGSVATEPASWAATDATAGTHAGPGGAPEVAPSAGLITSWRLRGAVCPTCGTSTTIRLRTIDKNGAEYVVVNEAEDETLNNVNEIHAYTVEGGGLPIAQGDYFAIDHSVAIQGYVTGCGDCQTFQVYDQATSTESPGIGADAQEYIETGFRFMLEVTIEPDSDGDGRADETRDNCAGVANAGQADSDGDGVGDACDTCPEVSAADQTDTDGDGLGNPCDPDNDNDGAADVADNCPVVVNPGQEDADSDGVGSACDPNESLPGPCANRQVGDGAANQLLGSGFGDRLIGGRGADTLTGRGGVDCLSGGPGNDVLKGGGGNDTLDGGTGNDSLDGGPGNDKLSGGPGRNTYSSGGGNDTIAAVNDRAESVRCGTGRDTARIDRLDTAVGCESVRRVG